MFKKIFMNFKISMKLFLVMCLLSIFTSVFIGFFSYKYTSDYLIKTTWEQIEDSMGDITIKMNNDVNIIYSEVVTLLSSYEFDKIFTDIRLDRSKKTFATNYGLIQENFEKLIRSHQLIDQIYILGRNGEFFSYSTEGTSYKNTDMNIWSDVNLEGIQWYDFRVNPFKKTSQYIIPIFFPVSAGRNQSTPFVVNNEKQSVLNILLTIRLDIINSYLKEMNKIYSSKMYLLDNKGVVLNSKDSFVEQIIQNKKIQNFLSSNEEMLMIEEKINGETTLIAISNLKASNLIIINAISKVAILQNVQKIYGITTISVFVSFCVSMILSYLLSKIFTKPIKNLSEMVSNIEKGDYENKIKMKYNDEIGILGKSVNNMSITIKNQLIQIKKEEKELREAEINLLSEQINPHFLYNTLECIHWEILMNNNENASNMVESLGSFLRLSLNNANELITISQELDLLDHYLKIINHRLYQKITFERDVPLSLMNYKIIKLILQPLIENCIKHAFKKELMENVVTDMIVKVTVQKNDDSNTINIIITDNGFGIDIDKATKSMYEKKTEKVGLNNVYMRLKHYYQDVSVEFSSIPFYNNSIIITIPAIDII